MLSEGAILIFGARDCPSSRDPPYILSILTLNLRSGFMQTVRMFANSIQFNYIKVSMHFYLFELICQFFISII